MSDISIGPDSQGRSGFAEMRVRGGAGFAATPQFQLSRHDRLAPHLGPAGWQPEEATLKPCAVRVEGDVLVLSLGPEIVDVVEAGTVKITIVAEGSEQVVKWPDLPSSHLIPLRRQPAPMAAEEAPSPPVVEPPTPPVPVEVIPPPPAVEPPDPLEAESLPSPVIDEDKRFRLWRLLAAILGLVAFAAVVDFVWLRHAPPFPPIPVPMPTPVPQTGNKPPPLPLPPAAPDCDSKSPVDILKCEADPVKLYTMAQGFAQKGNWGLALAFYGAAEKHGYGPAALALAQLYDPTTFDRNSAITQPDAGEAAKYYREAISDGDQDAAAPRKGLQVYLENRKKNGDLQAINILSDYWP